MQAAVRSRSYRIRRRVGNQTKGSDEWRISAGYPENGSGNIGRADDAQAAPVEDMGVPLGRSDVAMPEQFLNRADIIAAFQKVSGEAVAIALTIWKKGEAFDPKKLNMTT